VSIDHYSSVPLYLQLAALLREQIGAGEIEAGSFLPSLRVLTEEHQVSRMTAERAVQVLRDEGLVRGLAGRGVYVLPEAERGRGGRA
jgi:DNA-binding GntR family transcriptional regulator